MYYIVTHLFTFSGRMFLLTPSLPIWDEMSLTKHHLQVDLKYFPRGNSEFLYLKTIWSDAFKNRKWRGLRRCPPTSPNPTSPIPNLPNLTLPIPNLPIPTLPNHTLLNPTSQKLMMGGTSRGVIKDLINFQDVSK